MKQFKCYIITIILLVSSITSFQTIADATTDIEIHGQIGRNETTIQPSIKPEPGSDTKLAQPKQTHIRVKNFPTAGSIVEQLTPIGLLLLLIFLLLSRWKAHRNK
ncbi:hypothetical protein CI088_06620 [Enterococcus plantarum]|uniref:Gram-positive cocci surface proteins LPxTG domain-containing protein n=1 Tax=Enterococcus plantarum TaxID=1077675 RepID=A0A2W3ZC20_9ENTE|nr:hypothetical protein [Enterococcus plantarum]PZL74780.1 hypothetical protein CI088_06620 [Enterococcus plantarum]